MRAIKFLSLDIRCTAVHPQSHNHLGKPFDVIPEFHSVLLLKVITQCIYLKRYTFFKAKHKQMILNQFEALILDTFSYNINILIIEILFQWINLLLCTAVSMCDIMMAQAPCRVAADQ